jgi:hypothetical protein
MKALPWGFIILGVYLLIQAAGDESKGVTTIHSPRAAGPSQIVERSENPQMFRNAMVYQWLRASLFVGAGLVIRGICRRADRTDPFSPHFAGSQALDELNKKLTQEEEHRREPPL